MVNSKSYRGIHFFCIACLFLAALGLGTSLVMPLFAGSSLLFSRSDVNLMDVQEEVSKKAGIRKQIEALRDLFPNFDNEQWGQARDLISTWVDELGGTPAEKTKFIAEVRVISAQFPPDQRTQAIDSFYRLKKDKLLSSGRSLQSWAAQFGALNALFFSLLLIGFFMAVLMLVEIARHLKLRDSNSS